MSLDDNKQFIKDQLIPYLEAKGINTKKSFHCLNPEHNDKNPSMSYDKKRNKVHCFSCNADYDTFDLIGIDKNISDPKEIFKEAYKMYNLEGYQNQARIEQSTHTDMSIQLKPSSEKKIEDKKDKQKGFNFQEYFSNCHARMSETDYLYKRGISAQIIRRFNIGYDPTLSTNKGYWKAIIIPTGKESYTARNTDPESKDRIRNRGTSLPFNPDALDEEAPVYIVEGEIDALSILEVGGSAISLGGVSNKKNFLNLLRDRKEMPPLIISLDNDTTGKKETKNLAQELDNLEIGYFILNPYGDFKDANDALLANREEFTKSIKNYETQVLDTIEKEKEKKKQEYKQKNSVKSHLQNFIDGIADSVNTPYIPTGFTKLDNLLDGGLYEGLYIIGAISSLGKTTLIMQVADQIAENGNDVLIFSLEMARTELMSKSISRLTLIDVLSNNRDMSNAKTARGITTGTRYEYYSNEEQEVIRNAITAYSQYASNIYIHEGVGNIGIEEIKKATLEHETITGNKPVVIIDYLQTLSPYDMRATEKQNTDIAVMELKRISRDQKIPIIGISSFNRSNYNSVVNMSAFKESGAIEYGSDVLIGLQLKGVGESNFDVDKAKSENPREVELKILKNRNGATGKTVEMKYYPLFNYFIESN